MKPRSYEALRSILNLPEEESRDVFKRLQDIDYLDHHHHRILQQSQSHPLNSSCFLAINGLTHRGEDFVASIIDKIALAIVSSQFKDDRIDNDPVLAKKIVRISDPVKIAPELASWFYQNPSTGLYLIGITGTNGKTSTAYLIDQLWQKVGINSAIIGTLGFKIGDQVMNFENTTPDALDLEIMLSRCLEEGVTHVVMEVSSHALKLGKVEHLQFDQVIFTNLTPEHLDFHNNMEQYYQDKAHIFDLLKGSCKPNKKVLISYQGLKDYYDFTRIKHDYETWILADKNICSQENLINKCKFDRFFTYDFNWIDLGSKNNGANTRNFGSNVFISENNPNSEPESNNKYRINLFGRHNVENFSLAKLSLLDSDTRMKMIDNFPNGEIRFNPIPGRLEQVEIPNQLVYIDYAHTADALQVVLKELKLVSKKMGGRLICVFGCGGSRDRKKRSEMGRIAEELADLVVLTNDNPRDEYPNAIIDEIKSGMKDSEDHNRLLTCPDRSVAIRRSLSLQENSDVLLIAGKGHEDYQLIAGIKHHFNDREEIEKWAGLQ